MTNIYQTIASLLLGAALWSIISQAIALRTHNDVARRVHRRRAWVLLLLAASVIAANRIVMLLS